MSNGLNTVQRYTELYNSYMADMQKPKYSGNPEEARTEDLLRDLYKVICGNGNSRKSILHWSVDNGVRLTIASEDMDAIQATLQDHTTRLQTQEATCKQFRSIHLAGNQAAKAPEAQPHAATVVNVATAQAKEQGQSIITTLAQAARNVKDLATLTIMVVTAAIIIIGYLTKPVSAPSVTPDQAKELVKIAIENQLTSLKKSAQP